MLLHRLAESMSDWAEMTKMMHGCGGWGGGSACDEDGGMWNGECDVRASWVIPAISPSALLFTEGLCRHTYASLLPG